MADITMCVNDKCERRETCYRYCAKPDAWHQSYSHFVGGAQCVDWLPIYSRNNKAASDEA